MELIQVESLKSNGGAVSNQAISTALLATGCFASIAGAGIVARLAPATVAGLSLITAATSALAVNARK